MKWYALYTKPRHEKRVQAALDEKSIACYLPEQKVLKQWSDRKKWVKAPLFSSYIFIHADAMGRYRAVQTPGVVRLVMFRGEPAVVRDEEIDLIRRVLNEKQDVETVSSPLKAGDPVRVVNGPLTGLEGRIVKAQGGHRLELDIPSIQQSIRFSVNIRDVEMIA